MKSEFAAREVLIPMVGGAATGALARIAADGELSAPHSAQLDRSLAALLECGLYQAGQQGKAAVRLFHLPGRNWLGRNVQALHVVNPGDVVGLGAENSSSAELGLALALLMFAAQTKQYSAVASGALGLSSGQPNIPVLPVHHLGRKLRLVIQHFSQPGSAPPPQYFLVPMLDPDGAAVQERYREEAQALNALGMELRGVTTLADAAQIIGARRQALSTATHRAFIAFCALTAALVIAACLHIFWNASIALDFLPIVNANGSITATPARTRRVASGVELLTPCSINAGDLPTFAFGDRMVVQLQTGDPGDLLGRLVGYHHALIAVSVSSGAKTLAPRSDEPIEPGTFKSYLVEVSEPEEETLLIWLAKRGGPFDTAKLDDRLRRVLQPLPPAARISAARNLLRSIAPNMLVYAFRSVRPEECT